MPWPMSCPPGEDRSQGEGAAGSHWASIILLVAVPPCAGWSFQPAHVSVPLALTLLRAPAYFMPGPVTGTVHAAMQSDAARALQCRAPSAQSRRHGCVEPGDLW